MRNILKTTAFILILSGTILSCGDRYGIESQTDKITKQITLVSDSTYSFEAIKAREVVLSINSSTRWQCVSSESWCTVSPNTSDSSSLITDLTIKLKDNVGNYNPRTATLTFSAEGIEKKQIIEIVQNGLILLDVKPMLDLFPVEGGALNFTVQSNREFSIKTSADWLSISPMSGVPSDKANSISVSALDNRGKPKRSAKIIVKAANEQVEFVVQQQGIELKVVGQKDFLVKSNKSTLLVDILATTNWIVNIPTKTDWITANVLTGNNNGTITFTISENKKTRERSSYIYFETAWPSLKDSILITQW